MMVFFFSFILFFTCPSSSVPTSFRFFKFFFCLFLNDKHDGSVYGLIECT